MKKMATCGSFEAVMAAELPETVRGLAVAASKEGGRGPPPPALRPPRPGAAAGGADLEGFAMEAEMRDSPSASAGTAMVVVLAGTGTSRVTMRVTASESVVAGPP